MRIFKAALIVLIIGGIVLLAAGCNPNGNASPTPVTQQVPVQKGTITISVTGTGNLAYAKTEDIAFETAGTVDQVLVDVSDSVKKGQELARLDSSDWESQIETLTKALEAANRDLANKQNALIKAQRQVTAKELALKQAQLDLQVAQNNLSNISDVKEAQDAVDSAELNLKAAQANLQVAISSGDATSVTMLNQQIKDYYTPVLNKAQQNLKDVLNGAGVNLTTNVSLQIAQNQLNVQQKQLAVGDAQTAIDDANTAVANARQDVADAEQAVSDAKSKLEETQSLNLSITAPFDGFITKVNVQGGNEVKKGTVALQIADPNQFEANFMVAENDIFSVKLGGDATVDLDALSGLSFPAKITAIAPLATTQQGVVNYKVTAQLTSLKPVNFAVPSGAKLPTSSSLPSSTPGGTAASNLPSGAASTSIPSSLPGGVFPGSAGGAGSRFADAMSNFTLKDGLSATVTVIIQQKENVLVVPNRAITRQAGKSTVQVVKGGTTEERTVKTGLSDSTNTEITDGLSEGEIVIVKSTTSSSSSNAFRVAGPGQQVIIR